MSSRLSHSNARFVIDARRFKVMRATGAEFKLTDLLAPTYQRTRRFLSAIINLAKYREEKFAKFEELDQQGERIEEAQLMAEDTNQAAMAELAEVRAEVAAEEPQMRELSGKLASINEEMEFWKKELAAAQVQQQGLEKKLDETAKRNDRLSSTRVELERSRADLVRRIIPEPEKELSKLEDFRARQAKEEELLTTAQRTRADRAARRDQLEKSRKAVSKAITICQDISEALDHVKAERKAIKDYKASAEKNEKVLREYDVNVGRMQTQIDAVKDRIAQISSEHEKVRDEKFTELEAVRGRKAAAERDQAEVVAQRKALDLEVAKLETEEAALQRGHKERTSLMAASINSLIGSLRTYHTSIHASMRDTMQAQQEALSAPRCASPGAP